MSSTRTRALYLAGSLTLILATAACGQSAAQSGSASGGGSKDTIVIAAVPSEQSQSLQNQYDPVIKLLEKETGKKIQFQNATDYAAVIEGQRAGKIDLAGYGPFSYKIAKDGGVPVEPVGTPVKTKDTPPGYYSMGWVPGNSPIASLNEFKGKKVCFVDKASTSGYLYPSAGLKAVGIDPEKDVTPVMAGGHDASLLAIKSGQCEVGFAYDTMIDQVIAKGSLKQGDVKQVWKSEQIAGSPLAMNTKTLDADTQAKIREAITKKANVPALVEAGICPSADKCDMPDKVKYGYVAIDDKAYDGIRKVCEVTKSEACN
ncbi:phosphate/phosphite/phosphonate ABC transporter substrate-binding protein [Naumannella sp. ID2617S]|nr:phosphate/phosphite/phosphonate ABC transporter substrate-binding protein [Naumannella sp. ID2617S]